MCQARYEIFEDDGSFYGEIPPLPCVWANAKTLEDCREELESVPEGSVLLSIADHSCFTHSANSLIRASVR